MSQHNELTHDDWCEMEFISEPEPQLCKVCGEELDWVECWSCGGEGEGDEFHDCGEDCCCCADPEPGICPECNGKGGWLECPLAEQHSKGVSL